MTDSLRIGVLSVGNVLMGDDGTELGYQITGVVQAAVVPAISAILAELTRIEAPPRLRSCALEPSIWWQDAVSSGCSDEEPYVPGNSR